MSEPAKTEDLQGLTWPTPAIDLSGEGVPVQLHTPLQSLHFVATDEDRKTATAPDQTWSAETPASRVLAPGAPSDGAVDDQASTRQGFGDVGEWEAGSNRRWSFR